MTPSTGQNKIRAQKNLSIRLSPDGLSFWTADSANPAGETYPECRPVAGSESTETFLAFGKALSVDENLRRAASKCVEMAGWQGGPVRLMPDTRNTVLIPAVLFDPRQTDDYLALNSIGVSGEEKVFVSRLSSPLPDAAVVMVYDRAAVGILEEAFGNKLWITSLFDAAAGYQGRKFKKKDTGKDFTTLYLTPSNVYITIQPVTGGDWKYCEALPYSSPADVLYYMHELAAKFDIRKTPLYIKGYGAEKAGKVLRKPFKRCKCE